MAAKAFKSYLRPVDGCEDSIGGLTARGLRLRNLVRAVTEFLDQASGRRRDELKRIVLDWLIQHDFRIERNLCGWITNRGRSCPVQRSNVVLENLANLERVLFNPNRLKEGIG